MNIEVFCIIQELSFIGYSRCSDLVYSWHALIIIIPLIFDFASFPKLKFLHYLVAISIDEYRSLYMPQKWTVQNILLVSPPVTPKQNT